MLDAITNLFSRGDKGKTTREGLDTLGGKTQFRLDLLEGVVYILLFVMAMGFLAMFVAVVSIGYEAWTNKAATYQQLEDKVDVLMMRTQPSPSPYVLPSPLLPKPSGQ